MANVNLNSQKTPLKQADVPDVKTMADALVASIGDGVIIVNEYGIITNINQVALDVLRAKRAEMVGEWLPKAIPSRDKLGNDIPTSERLVVKALVTGKPLTDTVTYVRKDGSTVPILGTASPYIIKDRPRGAIIVFRDVSREMQIERAKDEFISLTSHQLRTPLTSISFFSEMLASGRVGELSAKQKEYAQKIHLSTTRMIRLVGNILNVSRIELDRLKIESMETDLISIVEDYIEEARPLYEVRKISVDFINHPKEAIAKVDAALFGQVIHNLLTNAIRYSASIIIFAK